MKGKSLLKPLDIPVIVLATALTVAVAGMVYTGKSASSRVVIRGQDKTWVYPLDAEVEVKVAGPIGETIVQIHQGRAAIVSSPCANQTCVAAGALHKNGQWAACLPNKVFILVEGVDSGDAIDAASW